MTAEPGSAEHPTAFAADSILKGAVISYDGDALLLTGVDLDPDPIQSLQRSYALELARTGARRADWWAFGEWAVVLIIYGEPVPAPLVQIAVQLVPKGWVWEVRGRTRAQKGPFTNLSWSWANVVDCARAEAGSPDRRR